MLPSESHEATKGPQPPSYPVMLWLWITLALLTGSFYWWWTKPPATTPPRSCAHWLEISGALEQRATICLRGTRSQKQQSLHKTLQRARPRCVLSTPPPLLGHRSQLFISPKTKGKHRSPCTYQKRELTPSTALLLGFRLKLNKADENALSAIPGIRKGLPKRIVKYRQQHGPFQSINALQEVKGIGAKTVEKLRPFLKIDK